LIKIACIGQQCSGKTSLAKFFINKFSSVFHIKLADPIYNALDGLKQEKHRAFMQQFGDLAKKHFGEEIFAQILEKRVLEIEREAKEHEIIDEIIPFENQILIVNDDVRFGYEMKYMKRLGFKLCSIICPVEVRAERARAQGLDFIENHQSETEIPQLLYKADFVLTRGEMSMEELGVAADDILRKIKVQG
jgi:dephospho-CoA kinase